MLDDGKILATTASFKYLGVQITDNFSWDLHVNSVTFTATQRLGMIKRVLFNAPKERLKKVAYVTLQTPFRICL